MDRSESFAPLVDTHIVEPLITAITEGNLDINNSEDRIQLVKVFFRSLFSELKLFVAAANAHMQEPGAQRTNDAAEGEYPMKPDEALILLSPNLTPIEESEIGHRQLTMDVIRMGTQRLVERLFAGDHQSLALQMKKELIIRLGEMLPITDAYYHKHVQKQEEAAPVVTKLPGNILLVDGEGFSEEKYQRELRKLIQTSKTSAEFTVTAADLEEGMHVVKVNADPTEHRFHVLTVLETSRDGRLALCYLGFIHDLETAKIDENEEVVAEIGTLRNLDAMIPQAKEKARINNG